MTQHPAPVRLGIVGCGNVLGGKASEVTYMAALYSTGTIPLAVLVLGEQVTGREGLGIALSLAAVAALSYEKPSVPAQLVLGK